MSTIIGADGRPSDGSADVRPPADLIKDVDSEGFAEEVLQASMTTPVIVDFWAPWCGPCKQLTPALEKAVTAARGAVRLVKVNIDENQELAAQMRIQSVPAVYAFLQGRPVDGFVGAQTESQVKAFVERLVEAAGASQGPDPLEEALEQAQKALDSEQYGAASALFGQVLQHDPENTTATAGLIRAALGAGDAEGAKTMFDALPEELREDEAFASLAASFELADMAAESGDIAQLTERLAGNPGDHQARYDLALALFAAGRESEAADALLELLERDRAWNEEAARKQLLKIFEAWGPTHPQTLETRRRLSALLFS